MSYDISAVEKKWQKKWKENPSILFCKQKNSGRTEQGISLASTTESDEISGRTEESPQKKFYCLDMFPYPSGSGLHVGHWRGYVLSDIYTRIKWLEGYNILHPMGWDAFGLPAENDAIKKGIQPAEGTASKIAHFKKQLKDIEEL